MPGTDVNPVDPLYAGTTEPSDYARATARWYNIKEHQSTLVFVGKLVWPNGKPIESGTTVMFQGVGPVLDGKWIIERVIHEIIDSKFRTTIKFYRCLAWDSVTGKPTENSNIVATHPATQAQIDAANKAGKAAVAAGR